MPSHSGHLSLSTVNIPLTLWLLDVGHFTKCNIEEFLLRKILALEVPRWKVVLASLTVATRTGAAGESGLDLRLPGPLHL